MYCPEFSEDMCLTTILRPETTIVLFCYSGLRCSPVIETVMWLVGSVAYCAV
jgi:uncharacterized membrane protein